MLPLHQLVTDEMIPADRSTHTTLTLNNISLLAIQCTLAGHLLALIRVS